VYKKQGPFITKKSVWLRGKIVCFEWKPYNLFFLDTKIEEINPFIPISKMTR